MRNTLFLLLAAIMLLSCYDDKTTNADKPISLIAIDENSVQAEYNIAKNDVLVITPTVSQTIGNKQMRLTWEVGDDVYTGNTLRFKATELGTLRCRLIAENEDGRAFLPFVINVNTPYEEGITLLSVRPDGGTELSFMLHNVDGTADNFYDYECYTANNPDEEELVPGGADLAQCAGRLLITCSGDASHGGAIYYINEKTFVLENVVKAPEYPNFHPTLTGVPRDVVSGPSFPILCQDGTVYYFSPLEGALSPSAKYPHKYAQSMIVTGRSGGYFDVYMWDQTIGDVCAILNAYGPYYLSNDFHCRLEEKDGGGYQLSGDNYFANDTFEGMVMARSYKADDESQLIVFTRPRGSRLNRTIFHYGWWVNGTDLSDNGGKRTVALTPASRFTPQTPMVATMRYGTLLYAAGNNIVRWAYTTNQYVEQAAAKPIATVGTSKAVVTAMTLSKDHSQTYVAFYEPDQDGKNGHVWCIATETGEVLARYDNVCYRPTCMIYKNK